MSTPLTRCLGGEVPCSTTPFNQDDIDVGRLSVPIVERLQRFVISGGNAAALDGTIFSHLLRAANSRRPCQYVDEALCYLDISFTTFLKIGPMSTIIRILLRHQEALSSKLDRNIE